MRPSQLHFSDSTDSAPPGSPRRAFPFLPGALLLCGVALCCWMACGLGAVVSGPTAEIVRRENRAQIRTQLLAALPPSASHQAARERLDVFGDLQTSFIVNATGDFTPESAKVFATATHRVHLGLLKPHLSIRIFNDATDPPTMVAGLAFDDASDAKAAFFPHLPATANSIGLQKSFWVEVNWTAQGDQYTVTLIGPYQASEVAPFVDFVTDWCRTRTGGGTLLLYVRSNATHPTSDLVTLRLPIGK
jgi:hypothetical protein